MARKTTTRTTKKSTRPAKAAAGKKPVAKTRKSTSRTATKRTPVQDAVILKQHYEGRCGGIMKYCECDVNVAVFSSVVAFCRFWEKTYGEQFCFHNPYDRQCRRDGFYLERLPMATETTSPKEMRSCMRPAREWKPEERF